jgi:hypothetical protein
VPEYTDVFRDYTVTGNNIIELETILKSWHKIISRKVRYMNFIN